MPAFPAASEPGVRGMLSRTNKLDIGGDYVVEKPSVIILVVHYIGIAVDKFKNDAPVAGNVYGP